MTDLEWKILDEVYLMNDYRVVLESVQESIEEFDATLVKLLEMGLLRQLIYNDTLRDYADVDPFDRTMLSQSHYVITRQGLLAHTGTT